MISRRGFLSGLAASLAAPAVVKSGILMPMRGVVMPDYGRQLLLLHDLDLRFTVDLMMAAKEVMKAYGVPPCYLKEPTSADEARYVLQHQTDRLRPRLEALGRGVQQLRHLSL